MTIEKTPDDDSNVGERREKASATSPTPFPMGTERGVAFASMGRMVAKMIVLASGGGGRG
ncbi:MAG: hypothetical protein AAF989_05905 [Planctomycetota bacterium]